MYVKVNIVGIFIYYSIIQRQQVSITEYELGECSQIYNWMYYYIVCNIYVKKGSRCDRRYLHVLIY